MFAMEYKRIGLNILYHRRSKGWTQEMLANKSGVSRSRISDINVAKKLLK